MSVSSNTFGIVGAIGLVMLGMQPRALCEPVGTSDGDRPVDPQEYGYVWAQFGEYQ